MAILTPDDPLVATLGGVGYCLSVLASGPLAIAVGLLGGWYMVDKVKRGEKAFDDIENGRIERYLNESQRRVLAQLPPVIDPLLSPSTASTPQTQQTVDAVVTAVDVTAPPISEQWSGQQWQLWQRLVKDCPELRYALMCKLLVVSGPQQTGKSSLASAIAYLRSYLMGWPTIAVTPHVDGEKIFDGRVVGAGSNFESIQEFYTDLVENFTMGGDRQSLVIDELTQYTNEHKRLGQSLVRTALSESDKHGIAPILINHAKTLSGGFAGIEGVRELLDSSAIQLTRQYGETPWGEQTRSAEVRISRPGHNETTITIPDWLYLDTLQQQYPIEAIATKTPAQVAAPAPVEPQQQPEPANPFEMTAEVLERLYEASPNASTAPDDQLVKLPLELRAIAEFAHRQNRWVTAREVRSGIPSLKEGKVSTEVIRGYFRQLASQGLGAVDGEGDRLKYRF
ncbi:hypothetical protein [Leptolyngbya sp. PL-A3]|uniref:hypothetical protein n=1 Tax=Leptolyngbya sp. PL-A3 TaxID=2933911 RepID=UPI0032987333